jgi:NodT family efflux transporter outer membrane factor (OMF) lipoprotein
VRSLKRLLEEQLETSATFAELTELRFQTGQASALDVYQQQQNVLALRARIALLEGQATLASNQLAALVGEPPHGVIPYGPDALPAPAGLPPVGVPATILARRPDVRAAQRRVTAADQRVGSAIAARFPTLRLTGSIGFGAQDLLQLFEDVVWSIVGSITQSIIDGGRRSAEVDRNRAIVQERLEQYGQTVITALVEVDNALALERAQRRNIEELEHQLEVLDDTLTEARNRYRAGLSDFLNVLTALTQKQQAEIGLLEARRALVSSRVQLHRALGGTWTAELAAPEPRELEEAPEEAE